MDLNKFQIIVILMLIIMIIPVVYLFYLGKKSEIGDSPGLIQNQLMRCPETPNCVCSEYTDDVDHFIEPLRDMNNLTAISVEEVVEQLDGRVMTRSDTYVSAIFVSQWFGFVDDVEFRIDQEKGVLHIRSASRVGRSDMGVNLERVEKLKKLLHAKN